MKITRICSQQHQQFAPRQEESEAASAGKAETCSAAVRSIRLIKRLPAQARTERPGFRAATNHNHRRQLPHDEGPHNKQSGKKWDSVSSERSGVLSSEEPRTARSTKRGSPAQKRDRQQKREKCKDMLHVKFAGTIVTPAAAGQGLGRPSQSR